MTQPDFAATLAALPKAELHVHLEGSLRPATVVELAARHGARISETDVLARYSYKDFAGFLDAFRWVTGYLRTPADFALITEKLGDELLRQNVVYAEVIASVGVMLLRKQDVAANFAAMRAAALRLAARGLRIQWIFDAAWQFGPAAAVEVARIAAQHKTEGVVGFGMGGDELAFPFDHFSPAFDLAAEQGLRRTVHAGEIGEPTAVLLAIEPLRAERVGHGIAALRDPGVTEWLTSWHIPLELCPTSNLRTGALARQLGKETATAQEHPLRVFFERGLRVVLSTDDPAMFGTTLLDEYNLCQQVGMTLEQTVNLAEMSFAEAFLPDDEKTVYLAQFQSRKQQLGLTE